LRFSVPDDWQRVPSPSPLRVAQFTLPHARGDDEDGELILFTFEDPQGPRTLSDAVERWYSQFTQPDGRPSREVAVVTTRKMRDLDVKIVDLSGTYRAQMGPMEHPSRPGYRLLGAVVESQGGPWYWQAVGPSKTIEQCSTCWRSLVALHARRMPRGIGHAGLGFVVRRRGDRQLGADRLNPVRGPVGVDERHHHFGRRSSSAWAKNADALRRISLARRSSRFSRSSVRSRSRSSVERPGRTP
jgi:hypothetical protein